MPAKQRIMMISTHGYVAAEPELGKPDTGGQVVYVLELSKCLARLGYAVDIVTRRFEKQPRQEEVDSRCRILRFPCGGKDFIPKETLCEHIPELVDNARQHIRGRRIRYNYIVSHYWDAGLAGQALAEEFRIPHIHVPHSLGAWKRDNMDGDPEALEREYNFRRRVRDEKRVYDECDAVIATTPPQRDILVRSEYDVPSEKVFVVPPGYDETRFFPVSIASRDALRSEYGYEGRIILALGRIAHNKGYDLLVRAMRAVFERVEDAKLVLAVGASNPTEQEQKDVEELKSIARELGILDRVIFRDYIEDEELPDYYRLASVFALSSRYEPFGMTAVEAMACGTPTVVTTEGGLWEQVVWGLEALSANPFDPDAFGHAICFILQQPRLADQLARYGSQKARARFTWMGIAQQLLGLMQGFRLHAARTRADYEHGARTALPADEALEREGAAGPTLVL